MPLRFWMSEEEVDNPRAEVRGDAGDVAPTVDGPQLDLGTLIASTERFDVTLGSADAAVEICIAPSSDRIDGRKR